MLKRIAFGIAVNMGALWITSLLLDKFSFTGGIPFLLVAGTLIGVLNYLVKPIVKLLSFPMIFFSAGLFLMVIKQSAMPVLHMLVSYINKI